MKLLITPTSPYARKARIVLREKNIDCEEQVAVPWTNDAAVTANSPLRKIPVLLPDAGEAIVDSRVICEYLDGLNDAAKMLPDDAAARTAMQTRAAIAEGAMDSALAIVMATMAVVKDKEMPGEWRQWLMDKVDAALDYFERAAPPPPQTPDLADVTLGCLLGALDFRMPEHDWRGSRPALAAYWQALSARPSFADTAPHA